MRLLASYAVGLLFGLGIVISGMGDPAKVVNFFDVAGAWDPSLAFVMAGALGVAFVGYRLTFRRARPIFEARFSLPPAGVVDARLVGGSALFGVGWGIAGFCPGGALPMLGTGVIDVFLFVAALVAGMQATRLIARRAAAGRRAAAPAR